MVNLAVLNILPKGHILNIESLVKFGIVNKEDAQRFGVKILGGGQLNIPLSVQMKTSKNAAEKIKKAGGRIGE